MTWYERVIAAHTAVTDQVSHIQRMNSDRYFIWQEDGRNDLISDGAHSETVVTGSTDLYTTMEFDPWAGAFEAELDRRGISWSFSSLQLEEESGFLHYEWNWEVLSDGHDPGERWG